MIAIWMLRLFLATALIALAARAAEEAVRGFGWPRRWVWAGAFLLVVLLPWLDGLLPAPSMLDALLDRLAPTATVGMPAVPIDVSAFAAAARQSESQQGLVDAVLLGGWTLASLVLAFVFGRALWRVRIARRRCELTAGVGGVEVIRSESLGPATVGIIRPAVVLPHWVDELLEAEHALIMSHECEHAAARDPLLLVAAALVVVAAPWCLPLWWMHSRLRDAAEMDCDGRVVARGADRLDYGRALLRAAGRPRSVALPFAAALLAEVGTSRLERRIRTMTEARPKHPLLRAVPLIGVASIAALVACDAATDAVGAPEDVQMEQQQPREEGRSDSSARSDTVSFPAAGRVEIRDSVYHFGVERVEIRDTVTMTTGREGAMALEVASPERSNREPRVGSRATAPDVAERYEIVAEDVHVRLREEGTSDGSAGGDPVFYIDGERVGAGSAALDELDPATIDRIEVLKGKRVALYPPDHAAGVIQIFTKNR